MAITVVSPVFPRVIPQVFPQDGPHLAIRCEAFPAGIRAQDPADRRTSLGGDPGGWLEKP
jgi:hypothetical protein